MNLALRIAVGHGLGLLLAVAGAHAGLPLPWLLGPLAAAAAVALAGGDPVAPPLLRRCGQVVVGTAIGLTVTPSVASLVLGWIPWMAVAIVVSVVSSALLGLPFARVARLDARTAYYALLPGGLAEMASIAARAGARAEVVAVVQTLRVGLIVCVLPWLVFLFATVDRAAAPAARVPWDPLLLPVALGVGVAGAHLFRALRFDNPWMFGSLLAVALAAGGGVLDTSIPEPLYRAGQFLIGFTVGAQFRRDRLARLPRVAAWAVVFIAAMQAVMTGVALFLSWAGGLSFVTAVLATAVGGTAEMTITAAAAGADVALVVAFHVLRTAVVNGFAGRIFRLLTASGLLAAAGRRLPVARGGYDEPGAGGL